MTFYTLLLFSVLFILLTRTFLYITNKDEKKIKNLLYFFRPRYIGFIISCLNWLSIFYFYYYTLNWFERMPKIIIYILCVWIANEVVLDMFIFEKDKKQYRLIKIKNNYHLLYFLVFWLGVIIFISYLVYYFIVN